ncbi:hypothetical protein ACP4OV_003523 [Aristida adscensionis]
MDAENRSSVEELEEYNSIISQTFRSEKEFYDFYNSYAESKGFSIRMDKVRRKSGFGEVIWRRFSCSCEGYRSTRFFGRTDKKREPRALTRCGCEAKLDVQVNQESGLWFVADFKDVHNHRLAKPQHTFVLRSHRGISYPQQAEAIELGLGGLHTCQIMDVMDKNYGGETGFLLRDLYNFFARKKKERVEGRDAEYVLNYMREKQDEDSEYFFKYSVDDEGRLKNIFWSDAQSQMDYGAFGDVVVFDSTYRVNRYNLPFIPFVGANHHRSTVIFGCGILSDESVASYVWLLEAFLEAMQHKHPSSLITDGDYAMARAIQIVMPAADHRLCVWHIERNMTKYLRGQRLTDFRKFLYHVTEVDEFERLWLQFKETHEINDTDIWILRMYELRRKWSAAYLKGRCFLGMKTNQRSESLNSRLHKHLDRQMSLVDLVEHYEYCVSRIRRNEVELDARASVSVPFTEITADILEKRAARIFTPVIFTKVREHIRAVCEWEVLEVTRDNGGASRYEVGAGGSKRGVTVTCTFEGSSIVNASCPCRMLECEGIPCVHIFSVMRFGHIETIPHCIVNVRWTMLAKIGFPMAGGCNTHVWSEQMERLRGLRNKSSLALFKASRTTEVTDKVNRFFDDILDEDIGNNEHPGPMSFDPLPALFSSASRPFQCNVLDPKKIITKGAPRSSKRWKSWQDSVRRH